MTLVMQTHELRHMHRQSTAGDLGKLHLVPCVRLRAPRQLGRWVWPVLLRTVTSLSSVSKLDRPER